MKFKSVLILNEGEIKNLVSQVVSGTGQQVAPEQVELDSIIGSSDLSGKTVEIQFSVVTTLVETPKNVTPLDAKN